MSLRTRSWRDALTEGELYLLWQILGNSEQVTYVFIINQFVHFWCRIHLWFRWMGGLQAKSMTSQRYRAEPMTSQRATYKTADMRYYGNVMTTTRWRLYVTMESLWQQKYITSSVYDCTVEDVEYIYNTLIIHIQQQKYSHILNLL